MMMVMWLLFSWFAIFLQGSGLTEEFRIVGGRDAEPGEFPYVVSIQIYEEHNCGGSIITNKWILSAAHCFLRSQDPFDYRVLTGTVDISSEGKYYRVQKIIIHSLFDYNTGNNDIALVQLRNKILFDSSTYSINLPTRDTAIGSEVDLTGWGLTSYRPNEITLTLKTLSLLTISNEQCQDAFDSFNATVQITDEKICTFTKQGEGACHGDSGGPLVDSNLNRQVGIVSASIPCAKGLPDIFTRVYKYLDWINDEMSPCLKTKYVVTNK